MQETVKWLTDINSALNTLHACMILLSIKQLSVIASAIPYYKLFYGVSYDLWPHFFPRQKSALSAQNCLCSELSSP
jgi:hypothetical protein